MRALERICGGAFAGDNAHQFPWEGHTSCRYYRNGARIVPMGHTTDATTQSQRVGWDALCSERVAGCTKPARVPRRQPPEQGFGKTGARKASRVSLSSNRKDFDGRREPLVARADAVLGRGRSGRRCVNLTHGFHPERNAPEDSKALTIGIPSASEVHLRLVPDADRETRSRGVRRVPGHREGPV